MDAAIQAYHQSLSPTDAAIGERLYQLIQEVLVGSEHKVWHAHPVWFIEGNPIVGYSKLKDGVRMLFWSGQSFNDPLLQPEGKFKAADIRFNSVDEIPAAAIKKLLQQAMDIQWDYKNIVKRKGVLERLR